MMFHQPMNRTQRAKGSKVKNILQVTVLLAVVVWLLYQTKHSYDRRIEYNGTEYNKLIKEETDINFGRKINAGSENGISIEPHGKNREETTETGETRVDQDAFDQNSEEKAEEVKNESEESREDITNSGREETQQEQPGNVDDNGDSHIVGEVNIDGMQEGLRLPSQRDGDISNSFEENELPKDDAITSDGANNSDEETIKSDEATFSSTTYQTENGENAGRGSETGETGGEHSDNAEPVIEEVSSSSSSDDQSNKDISDDKDTHKEETVDAAGSDTEVSNNTVEDATTNSRSVVEIPNSIEDNNVVVPVNNGAPIEEVGSQVASDSQAEISGKSSTEAAATDTSSDGGNTNIPKSVEENNVVMHDSNGAPGAEGESQVDRISEGQATGNSSIEAATADASSEGENANLPNSSEAKVVVMSDNNGAPKDEEVQSETNHVSESEETDNSSEEAKTDTRSDNEQSNADKNSEASEKEAGVSEGANTSDAEVTTNNNDPKSSNEAATSSVTDEKGHVELPANREDAAAEEVQSQGNNDFNAENTGKNSPEEDKSEKSDDVANLTQNNEQNTGKNVEDATTEPESKDATTSDLGNSTELSSGNRTAEEGQEGSTGSESSNSGSEEDVKKSAEL